MSLTLIGIAKSHRGGGYVTYLAAIDGTLLSKGGNYYDTWQGAKKEAIELALDLGVSVDETTTEEYWKERAEKELAFKKLDNKN